MIGQFSGLFSSVWPAKIEKPAAVFVAKMFRTLSPSIVNLMQLNFNFVLL